ncbi:MAG: 4Fe-4S binding protein [Deltaproteobacteria bacterium]|nr:4Fe-4S binding protein [Deltaproteobacteria bacterium]
MDFGEFAEGPLLWVVFIIFLAAVVFRLFFFVLKIAGSGNPQRSGAGYYLATFGRFLIPFHKAVAKKPGYALLRYVFHLCLFIVPIWLGGHIVLWSQSRFEWDWTSLPDSWADWMTIFVVAAALFFLIRRAASLEHRTQSSALDYLVIVLAALPFLTGGFLTHGTLDSIAFFENHMRSLHVVSGELMMLMAAFLFCRTRLNPQKCTGCASCELSCPTGTIQTRDEGTSRIFTYSHYQCICCGSCVNTCPEDAAGLRHEISLRRFLQIMPQEEIRKTDLKPCARCGALFVPEPLFAKIDKTFTHEYLQLCPNCRKTQVADTFLRLSPRHARPGKKEVAASST